MKVKYVPIFVLVGLLAIMSGMPSLSTGITNYVHARYATNTQTQANTNECHTGTNCGITSPQTQGDGTANSPTNLQISKFNEAQVEEDPTVEPPTILITVDQCTESGRFPGVVLCRILTPTEWLNLALRCDIKIAENVPCTIEDFPAPTIFLRCNFLPPVGDDPQVIPCIRTN